MNAYKLTASIIMGVMTFALIRSGMDNAAINLFFGLSAGLFIPMARYSQFRWRFILSSVFCGIGAVTAAGVPMFAAKDNMGGIIIFGLITFVLGGIGVKIARGVKRKEVK